MRNNKFIKILFKVLFLIKVIFRVLIELRKFINQKYSREQIYTFSNKDFLIYIKERYFTSLSKVTISESSINGLQKHQIKKTIFYYPSQFSSSDLPWLHHEVFDKFSLNPSSYDHPELKYESSSWIIDAGAAEGFFTFFTSQKTHANLYAIEPVPQFHDSLMQSMEFYKKKHSEFRVISAALGDKVGEIMFDIDEQEVCSSKIISENDLSNSNDLKKFISVSVLTLDQIANDLELSDNGLIKMDIEDYEVQALAGATELMSEFRPKLAIAVYHSFENAKKCKDIILSANDSYTIEFRGYYGWFDPPRPYMLFAY